MQRMRAFISAVSTAGAFTHLLSSTLQMRAMLSVQKQTRNASPTLFLNVQVVIMITLSSTDPYFSRCNSRPSSSRSTLCYTGP